uniref:Olfactory receptor n=1 Tax=Xenopus tropicalis TaxID=8364 RepID=F7EGA3_XENTR
MNNIDTPEIPRSNHSTIQEFILVGLKDLHHFQIPVFLLVFIVYVATILGNMLIIVLVLTNHHFQSPMYFFLSHLSLCDILISTNVTPNTLQVILRGESAIPVNECLTQLYFVGSSAILECCLLSIMSYDRYLAICNPLLYSSIMSHNLPRYLALWPWLAGFLLALITHVLVLELYFCGPNIINHFFCDLAPILELSCSDTSAVGIHVSIVVTVIGVSQMLFVIATYICIFYSILNISSNTGKEKAFSTCSSHLVVVSTYYGTLIALYLAPSRGYSLTLNKILSILNTVVTPLFNPIIYSLRNKEIRTETVKLVSKLNK